MSRWRIYRERVVRILQGARKNRVLLLLADAGFGKSIALQQLLSGADEPHAFFRVPPETTTLLGFLRGLTEALEPFVPGAHLSLTMAHERAMQSRTPFVELANWFGEHLRDARLRIVIDDLHNATSDVISDFLTRATAGTPSTVTWTIAARPSATFSAAPWLAQGELDWPIDEATLRFTPAELQRLAEHCNAGVTSTRLHDILEVTKGWPSATALALLQPGAPPFAAASPADLYESLAERVFRAYDVPTQELLLRLSVYNRLDAGVLKADGVWEQFRELFSRSGIYVDELGAEGYRYDGIFRAYLLRELGRDDGLKRSAFIRAAEACERSERWEEALVFYRKAAAEDAMLRLLADRGFALVDTGAIESLEAAVDALPEVRRDRDPLILALRAVLDSERARFDTSEAWYRLAIHELGDENLRLQIVHRYAIDLLRRGRLDCIDLLESAIESSARIRSELHPLLCSTLATAYALCDRLDDARTLISQAIAHFRPPLPEALLARGYHQAAYVALRCREIADAERYALQAVDIAVRGGLYELAARACSVLYEIAFVWNVNSSEALAHVESVAQFGLKSGDVAIQEWALIAAYYLAAERGDSAAMSAIERSLDVADVLQMAGETTAALIPGQALRATWSGDFAHAYRLLATAGDTATPDRRALRWAEIALYAAAAGLREPAADALRTARGQFAGAGDGKLALQAVVYALIAASLLGLPQARRVIRSDARLERLRPPLAALVRAADALDEYWAGNDSHAVLLDSLGELYAFGFAGIAEMLESLPGIPKLRPAAKRV
jgi:ATP/maltotriose-dependent transcriptional regulator MalT